MKKKLSGAEVRQAFIDYFKSKGHTPVASSALVPDNDPTLLFSNAGMNQFKDLFLGAEKRSYKRAVTSQKCLRISGKHNDLENVGVTARHHTFFEMLGNFSFGDYFKTDAIQFGWEFVTETLGISKSRLWVTVFEKDDEAAELWTKLTDIDPARIIRLGEKDNFWAMGETGPCGPCSEIHYFIGQDEKQQSREGFLKEDGNYLEIWNLVFMQYDRSSDGKLTPLPKPSVDTGMGLERITSVLQGFKANYDTDLLRPIISECEKLSGFKYDGSSYVERDLKSDLNYARDVAMRVIADHSRAISFLIADGVMPGSDGRGYVLRRLIRRAARHGRVLKFKESFLPRTCEIVINQFKKEYPELSERREIILKVSEAEEQKFYETLDVGLAILNRECEKLKSGSSISGELAFQLHDTYGFPLDLTADVVKAYNLSVDVDAFNRAMQGQKSRSRADRKSQGKSFVAINVSGDKTKFVGYETTTSEGKLLAIYDSNGNVLNEVNAGQECSLLFDATPFYAESGGQVGDCGTIQIGSTLIEVQDTQKIRDQYFFHLGKVSNGALNTKMVGSHGTLKVDQEKRQQIRVHHSATHIVHSALRRFLGDHVKQAGSKVDEGSLRFDFNHFSVLSDQTLSEIQGFINEEVRNNYPVITEVLPIEQAKKKGAVALFGEKYGEVVRVVEIGPNSVEFCGGTHVTRSGDIGLIIVGAESGVSAGVRRIECFAGAPACASVFSERSERAKLAELLKGDDTDLVGKIEKLLQRIKSVEKELEGAKGKLAASASGDLLSSAKTSAKGIKVIAERVDSVDFETLKDMVDQLRVKLGSGVVALGSKQGDQAVIVAGATADLNKSVNVGSIIKEVAQLSGGRGGGRADFAQAGGVDPSKLSAALVRVVELL